MKKDNSLKPVPATLWLESIAAFGEHARELSIERAYLSVSTVPLNASPLTPSGEGAFWILATARTGATILHYEERASLVTQIDAHVRPEETEKSIEADIQMMTSLLELAGLTVHRGKWTL